MYFIPDTESRFYTRYLKVPNGLGRVGSGAIIPPVVSKFPQSNQRGFHGTNGQLHQTWARSGRHGLCTLPRGTGQAHLAASEQRGLGRLAEAQTMLVNENRLNLADARARQYLARQMENHFFGGGADAAAGYVPPAP